MNMLLAYIDPAIGSMLIQAVAAVVLTGMVVGRRVLLAPVSWLKLKFGPKTDLESAESQNSN